MRANHALDPELFMALASGARLGPYEILSALGAGGMGEVYRARDIRLDRIVAIKVLRDALSVDPQFRERFDREARTISQLDHPHICVLYDVGQQEATTYLVMQYLDGETLADRLKRGALPLEQALQVATQTADALATAHKAGIVHRDLSPATSCSPRRARSCSTSGWRRPADPWARRPTGHIVYAVRGSLFAVAFDLQRLELKGPPR
jgi:hypothetical protein